MNKTIQDVSRNFFILRSEILKNGEIATPMDLPQPQKTKLDKEFAVYCNHLQPVILSISMKILKDLDKAMENVTKVLTKIYYSKTYEWKERSHLSYIYTISSNSAKMMKNKINRDKLVLESTLTSNEEGAKESILDYIDGNPNCDMLNYEINYLHNDSNLQFLKTIEIIEKMNDSEVIKDALGIKYDCATATWYIQDKHENLTYEEVAEKHGLNTAGAVKTKVFRAKKHIASELQKDIRYHQMEDGGCAEDGFINTFYRDGSIKMTVCVKDGKYNGSFTKYSKSGYVIARGTYLCGELHGEYKEFYTPDTDHGEDTIIEDGTSIKLTGTYKNGIKDGKWTRYWVDGSVMEEYEYMESFNQGEMEVIKFYEVHEDDGTITSGIYGDEC